MMICPVCESDTVERSFKLRDRFFGVTREEFDAFRCRSCCALFLDQDLVRERVREFYPENYWWSPGGLSGRLEGFYRKWVLKLDHLAFTKKALAGLKDPECLEIGSGSGSFTRAAQGEGIRLRGLEISASAVLRAREQGTANIETGTIEKAVGEGWIFDAVILFHVLEHLPDPRDFMKDLSAVLREGGMLILQVPNTDSWQAKIFGRRWYGLDCPRHVCNYSLKSLEALLGGSGFKIRMIETYSLRDNAPAFVSSLFPSLDPLGRRAKCLAGDRSPGNWKSLFLNLLYFGLVVCVSPFAWLESLAGKGATIKVAAEKANLGGRG